MQTVTLGHIGIDRRIARRGIVALLSAPLILAALLALWWLTAFELLKAQISQIGEHEKEQGRVWNCSDGIFGGFPFRIEARCQTLTGVFESRSPAGISIPSVHVSASLFHPFRVCIQFGSPLKLTQNGHTSISAQWRDVRAELRTEFGFNPKQLSVTMDELVINDFLSRGAMKLAHGEINILPRFAPDGFSSGADVTASADFLDFAGLGAPGYRANFEGRIDQAAALMKTNALDQFQKSGGRFIVDHFSLKRPKQELYVSGHASLADDHRLDGSFKIHASGIGNLLGGIVFDPDMDRDDVEIRLPLVVSRGVMSVGPYPLGEVPPLY